MMTLCEARQRLTVNNMRLSGAYRNWYINFAEATDASTAYWTDDLEDAVLMGGKMRRDRRNATAARYAFA
ncbi:hypothetical protein BSZ20_38055 [Bradyrhizobium canariense]|nr:hypothetical protein BSZ20_38055 [Bradyrhizobium canariense]